MENLDNDNSAVKSRKKLYILVGAAVILAIVSFASFEYTSQTGFCSSCHEMNTAFAGWDTGVHQTQHCYGCHSDGGFVNKLKMKVNGLKEVYLHLTKEINMDEVKSNIPSARCTTCHDMAKVDKYGERIVAFHKQHKELKYDCLNCHNSAGHTKNGFDGFNESCLKCHQSTKKNS